MNKQNGKNNNSNNIFGNGFSIRRFLLGTAPSFIENGSRIRNFDIERGTFENLRRDRKYDGNNDGTNNYNNNDEESYSRSNRKTSLDSSKEPLTTNTSTGITISSNNNKKHNKKILNNDPSSSVISSGFNLLSTSSSSSTPSSSSSSTSWNISRNQQKMENKEEQEEEIKDNNKWFIEKNFCPICYTIPVQPNEFKELSLCKHEICHRCLERYVKNEILEFRTTIACPQCSEYIHPKDIEMILRYDKKIISKYEDYMIRRYLLSDPDSRWCPAPECGYAVIAAGCASCPRIRCQRPGCGLSFCYHCKAEWHPDQTCDAARATRQQNQQQTNHYTQQFNLQNPSNRLGHRNSELELNSDDVKPCPRCHVYIVKMDDGSCNHMVCSICNAEFCWLCMKEISDLHYLSPSGCTFWGKKPWSRKKKIMWQIGTLIGAPVGIALVAGIAIPAMIIGIPVWIGKKIYLKCFKETRLKRNLAVATSVLASFVISPVLAGLAVAVGVPILLFYVYGVVPISLCRTGCNVTTSRDGLRFDFDSTSNNDDDGSREILKTDNEKFQKEKLFDCTDNNMNIDSVSRSIGDVSISVSSVSNIGSSDSTSNCNDKKYDQDSTTALAGSINDNGSCNDNSAINSNNINNNNNNSSCSSNNIDYVESTKNQNNYNENQQIDICSIESDTKIIITKNSNENDSTTIQIL
ncbi:E3 ubiquitin-protein ligase RNF19A-like [Condylostylus longicornis]|uniref:E3 ubiquitin-protein ligase RNF19A-like n=1 Tax=Condylostylus longicornis TaxID=2530218 RepID=UPI00244DDDFE|nr:E3 ubiquitin-protein ligase RNF19A-like [Condylostylus longicornis]XP_055373253.1 E3 ubiquitin-protein ligase RNF19A-like [Condylostylus longicornis]XP_055373254.1 E3 ubiquitin-protein ligase RNF19A-like [Condylostylus longicornis]XP_055373255.1 E3 ubiquitin-protein ligase RNF19A-like [Condylostylus longicornis]